MPKNRPYHYETNVVLAAGTQLPVPIPVPKEGVAVRIHRITHDEGLAFNNARTNLDLKAGVRHNRRGDVMQAGALKSFGAEPGPADGRNVLPCGYDVAPGDDMTLTMLSKVGAAGVAVRVEMTIIHDETAPEIQGLDFPDGYGS